MELSIVIQEIVSRSVLPCSCGHHSREPTRSGKASISGFDVVEDLRSRRGWRPVAETLIVIAERDTRAAVIDPQIVVLEDDPELRSLLVRGLREEGFLVSTAGSAAELLARPAGTEPDALVVDIGLPDADGRDVVQALRAQGVTAPVIFLTARDALTDRLAGFAAGGDDYLTKPFAFEELVARLHALIRRGGSDLSARVGELRLDPSGHAARCGGKMANLTPTEFRLLARLAAVPGDAVRRRQLVQAAWPHGAIVHDNTLDVYIGRLRRKLALLSGAPEIATVHGVGYSLR
jgi:two-component system, OmpR family, response regulator